MKMEKMSTFKDICGVIHVHFPIKKWKEYFEFLSSEALKAKIDFIILTSHTPKKKKEKYIRIFEFEGYYKNILIIHGEEIDEFKKNHLICLGEKKWCKYEKIEEIFKNKRDDLVYLVPHPYGKHSLFLFKKDYKWKMWEKKFDGMEIWSLLFDWAEKTKIYNLPVRYFCFPYTLRGPSQEILEKWDLLNNNRKVIGFAGLDIHCLPKFLKIFDIKKNFSYKNVFKTLRNHIFLKEDLTGNFEIDKRKILDLFKNGNFFFSNDFLGNSSGFYFGEKNGKYVCGDTGKVGDIILLRNPQKAQTRLIKNGKIIWEKFIEEEEIEIKEEGNYRVEVFKNKKNWIFTNNIYIKQGEEDEQEKI